MKPFEWYKKKYPDARDIYIDTRGRVDLPLWAIYYLLDFAGLRSRKKRLVRKVLKRELTRAINAAIEVKKHEV
jgi:hypothetical protein